MLNVLLLTQFFSTTKGGGEYVFKSIANVLSQNGHRVWVVTQDIKDELYQESENLRIIKVKPSLEYRGGLPPSFLENIAYCFNAIREAKKIVKKEKIDIIHSNNFSPALAGSIISYLTKTPHITTIHDIFSIYDSDFWKKWVNQSGVSYTNARLVPFFEKIMIRFRLDCIHTVSDATKSDILKIGAEKPIHVIPNCIIPEESLNLKVDQKQFVYLGRLVFYKNIEVIIKAFTNVVKEFSDARLVIAGNGPHKNALKDLAKRLELEENIEFRGYVTHEQKIKLVAESNAMLFPSKIEGFGLVILEAWQQKRPVLASDIPPMSEIIQDGKTGFTINSDNENAWAEKIIQIIKDPEIANEMGRQGNKTLKERYSQESFYQNIKRMYELARKNHNFSFIKEMEFTGDGSI